jgi:two-component system response regulator YesN
LISIFVSIAGTLLVSSMILYYNFENIALSQVYRSDVNSLNQISREVDNMTQIAKSLTSQIYSDLTISRLLYYTDMNVYDEAAAMIQLRNYSLSMPFIESVYVYNGHLGTFYICSNYSQRNGRQEIGNLDDSGILDILNRYKEYLPYVPIPRTYLVEDKQTKTRSYTYLGYDNLSNGERLDNAVIVNISEAWLNQNMSDPNRSAYTLIVDPKGRLVAGPGDESLTPLPYIRKLLGFTASSDYFVDTIDGTKSLISYTAPNEIGWRFVRVNPYQAITSKITSMRLTTAMISLSIILAGLIVSLILSRNLYSPISQAMEKLKSLEAETRTNHQLLKQEFLRSMLLGRETLLRPTLQKKLAYYQVNVYIRHRFRIMMLRVDRYAQFCEKYETDEQRLMKFAMQNIAGEIWRPLCEIESVDMGEDCVLLLLAPYQAGNENSEINESVYTKEACSKLLLALNDYLKLSVSITIGPVCTEIGQINNLYKQVYEASFHRMFEGRGCQLHAETILALKGKSYAYPAAKEKQLVELVMTGKVDESKRLLTEILDETGKYSYAVLQLAVSHLCVTMNSIIQAVQTNNAFRVESELDSTLISLQQFESLEEIKELFYRLFEEIGCKLEDKRKLKQHDLIRNINHWIEQDYANPDLNLNVIADKMGMTPAYISRLYKQFTLHSMTDAINDVRLSKAKELLLKTDIPVAELAEKAGFATPSYFFRMFKRAFSITPNDYRKMHRGAVPDK